MTIEEIKLRIRKDRSEKDSTLLSLNKQIEERNACQVQLEDLMKCRSLAIEISKNVQNQVHKKIEKIVQTCLDTIFDEPYGFEIIFEEKRGKTEARIQFTRDQEALEDPMKESGGGALDVSSFGCRLASLLLSNPKRRKLMILDEPFKFLSCRYRSKVSEMVQECNKRFGVQLIFVTHMDELKIGSNFEL